MKALLLNSGIGQRMGAVTTAAPKCMVQISPQYTIIGWQLALLSQCGIREVVITTGPFPEMLMDHVDSMRRGMQIQYVPNDRYRETNYIYSMHLAKDHLCDDIILLHGDMVLEKSVMDDLMSSNCSTAAVEFGVPLPEKDFKAKIKGGKIRSIGVNLFGEDCAASQPAYRFLKGDFQRWMQEISAFCEAGNDRVYAENAFNCISDEIALYPLALNGRLCNEIDNEEDLLSISGRFARIH